MKNPNRFFRSLISLILTLSLVVSFVPGATSSSSCAIQRGTIELKKPDSQTDPTSKLPSQLFEKEEESRSKKSTYQIFIRAFTNFKTIDILQAGPVNTSDANRSAGKVSKIPRYLSNGVLLI